MGDRKALTIAGFMFISLSSAGVAAAEIVRWVDENGVTQFTDPQLAPAPAEVVEVAPANGMDVPAGVRGGTRGTDGPSFTKISKPPKKNKRGWQGYQSTLNRNPRRHRR